MNKKKRYIQFWEVDAGEGEGDRRHIYSEDVVTGKEMPYEDFKRLMNYYLENGKKGAFIKEIY